MGEKKETKNWRLKLFKKTTTNYFSYRILAKTKKNQNTGNQLSPPQSSWKQCWRRNVLEANRAKLPPMGLWPTVADGRGQDSTGRKPGAKPLVGNPFQVRASNGAEQPLVATESHKALCLFFFLNKGRGSLQLLWQLVHLNTKTEVSVYTWTL